MSKCSTICPVWYVRCAIVLPDSQYLMMVQVGQDSAQGAGPQTMLQAMTRIVRWLARGSNSEGVVERAIRRSFIGELGS